MNKKDIFIGEAPLSGLPKQHFRYRIKEGAISTDKIEDKAITNSKIADEAVTNDKLAPEAITQDKFDKELLAVFKAAANLPEDLIQTIQDVDVTLKDHQQQITSNDEDISDLQTKVKQNKDTIDGIQKSEANHQSQLDSHKKQIDNNVDSISVLQDRSNQIEQSIRDISVTGGASTATSVSFDDAETQLDALNVQAAIQKIANNILLTEKEINVYDCSKSGNIKFDTLKEAYLALPEKFRNGGVTLKYCTKDNVYKQYTLSFPIFETSNTDILKLFENSSEKTDFLERELNYIKDSLIVNINESKMSNSNTLVGSLNRNGSINTGSTSYKIKVFDVSKDDTIHIVGKALNISGQAIIAFYAGDELNESTFISNVLMYEIYGENYTAGKLINIDRVLKIGEDVTTFGAKKVAIMVDSEYDIYLYKVSDIKYKYDVSNLESKLNKIEEQAFSFKTDRNVKVSKENGDFDATGNIISSESYHIKKYPINDIEFINIKGKAFNISSKIVIALYNGEPSSSNIVYCWRLKDFNNGEAYSGGKAILFDLDIDLTDTKYKGATTLAILEQNDNTSYYSDENFANTIKENKGRLYGKSLWTLCDSLGASNDWQKRLSEITGLTFDAELNNLSSAPISVGGTRSNPNSVIAGQQRAKNLVSYVGKKNIDIVIYECINDLYNVTGFDGNAGSIDDAPFFRKIDIPITPGTNCADYSEAKQYFESNISTIVSNITQVEVETGVMVSIPYGAENNKRYGSEIEITQKASADGVIMVRAGGTRNYITVTKQMTIEDIINSIINYSFGTGWEAIKVSSTKVRIVYFQENIYGVEIQSGDTGIAYTITDCGNISKYYRYYFGNTSKDNILNIENWKENVSLYSIYKGLIEYLTTNLPMSEIYFMFPNTLWASDKDESLLDSDSKFSYGLYMNSTRTKAYKEVKKIQKEVCDYYNIPFLDVENSSPINWFNRLKYYNNGDIHPKIQGYNVWAETIKRLLK